MKTHIILIVALLMLTGSLSAQDNTASVQLAAAIYEEEVTGDLDKAVALYQNILKEYPNDRPVAAKTLYHLGLVNEKMGKDKATEYFTRLVNTYPDQTEVVNLAKAKLEALGNAGGSEKDFLPKDQIEVNNQLTMKKLDNPQLNTPFARLAPDGKKIAYVEYSKEGSPTGINILEIGSGKTKILVEGNVSGQSSMVWSSQSNKIAYTFNGNELHIRDVDGSNSRLLLKNTAHRIYPTDWSRDGKKILCFFEGDDWKVKICTITSDGQVQFLVSGSSSDFKSEPKISPYGDYVACALDDGAGNTDIYVWTSDGSRKERVTSHPGRDENPVWSPDGKYLVFLSDRNRSVDLWGVQMKDGGAVGTPFILKQDLGWRTRINDLTAGGKLFLFMMGGAEPANLFTIPVEQVSGKLNGTIAPISVYPTDHSFPRYSPDGKMIAYQSRRGQLSWPKLFVLDEKGAERELPLEGYYVVNVAWHPRNQSLFFAGFDKSFKAGIYEVSLGNNEIKQVYNGDTVDPKTFKGGLININLIPGTGKMMFFKLLGEGNVEILKCDPDGQQLTVVVPRVKMPVWGLPSPTGENICYRIGDSLMIVNVSNGTIKLIGASTVNLEATWSPEGESLMFREGSGLQIFSVKENAARSLYQASAGKTIGGMEMYASAWSPDGSRFIFTESDTSMSKTSTQKLILINLHDGSFNQLADAPAGYRLSELRWSPDGRKLMATGHSTNSEFAPLYNYWILENFLPE
ncbi:MAG TPA: tetratricopeptide repeat protein [Bacteroidales bacterium]|nr:tetratricopeptide repeat protein [Bacteroidales bacterium]